MRIHPMNWLNRPSAKRERKEEKSGIRNESPARCTSTARKTAVVRETTSST